MAGTSFDLGRNVPESEKLYARELWADVSLPTFEYGVVANACSTTMLHVRAELWQKENLAKF